MAFPAGCYPKTQKPLSVPFVGALDALIAQGATVLFAGSVRRLLSSYAGDSLKLQGNGTGTPIASIPFTSAGDIDLVAAAAAASAGGGTAAAGHTWYDQTGTLDATQPNTALQMIFSTALQSKGGFGDGSAITGVYFTRNFGTLPTPSLALFVADVGSSLNKFLLGASASAFNRYCRVSSFAMQQNWGSTLAGTGNEVTTGKHSLGYLINGAGSKNILDGTVILTGDANNTQLDLSGGVIGAAQAGGFNWLSGAGNGMSEFILFGSDPTGLAGWADFVAAQKTYFGIA